ncbi:spermatogenesis-associated protein 20 isoform X1 [Huso huso]|uniref:Spermatogenesis-associated protein 20 isoform X1 n=1 Tax=Huso huso TaxID=61971 RepID=A0ABR0Z1U5_HUSHU
MNWVVILLVFPQSKFQHIHSAANSKTFQNQRRASFSKTIAAMATGGGKDWKPPHTNRLIEEKSPYLLQHAHNPVDWFPWGQEAFDKAKAEDKPIFLSVGYSTCHWCHVMEHESFESADIGKILSDNFVCIKVDREERPDVDKVYMTFVQATTGGGGWPMSVWLTPDLHPFIGGTYFPPKDSAYRPGFKTVLLRIAKQVGATRVSSLTPLSPLPFSLHSGVSCSVTGPAHTPSPSLSTVNLSFLFSHRALHRSSAEGAQALHMALHTLRMMALGGIHDHVAQGFHRYSTDDSWHVPHFEKMLYDQAHQAQPTRYSMSGDEFFAEVARDILSYVSRDLSDQSGGFYSAEDADSYPTAGAPKKKEGAFCVWTEQQIRELLPQPVTGATGGATQADIFIHHYGVKEQGNVRLEQDPHGELAGQNVLIVRYSLEVTAAHFDLSLPLLKEVLSGCRQRLAEVRRERPAAHLDSKMIAAWNGLMVSGFARVGAVLGEKVFIERAEKAAHFLRDHLFDAASGKMLRSCYRGEEMGVEQISEPISGFLDDYAFVIGGLLDLYEASLDAGWLEWAEALQDRQDQLFWDDQGSGYFSSETTDRSVLLRLKEDQDGAEPSANSVSVLSLLRLSHYTGRGEWAERSRHILAAFSDRLIKIPIALPEMVRALTAQYHSLKQVVIAGQPHSQDTQQLISCVNSHFVPNKVLLLADGNTESFLYQRLPVLTSMTPQGGKATAFVCKNFTCSLPVTSPEELRKLLLE